MDIHKKYMFRCMQLAKLGEGFTSPNPMVGAVLVHNELIIGEGYHQKFGQAHAEVNCINNVAQNHQHLISESTLYVSLEPCNHQGKTPACSHLIVSKGIKKVVVGCSDNFSKVNGAGIEYLRQHDIEVIINILEEECLALNKYFFYFNKYKKPFIVLKWAETANGFIGNHHNDRLYISNELSNVKSSFLRHQLDAILVGTNTVLKDNPNLLVKNLAKRNHVRIVLDQKLIIPFSSNIFNNQALTIILNGSKNEITNNIHFIKIDFSDGFFEDLFTVCDKYNIQSLLIEGGAKTLNTFIEKGFWNEAIIINNSTLQILDGIKAPLLNNYKITKQENILTDLITYYTNDTKFN